MRSKTRLVVGLGLIAVALVLLVAAFPAQGSEYGRAVCDELAASGGLLWTQAQYESWIADLVTAGQTGKLSQWLTSFDDLSEARARLRDWAWWGYDPERFPPGVYPQPDDYIIWVYEHEFQAGLYVVLPLSLGNMPHCQCVLLATADQVNALVGLLRSE